MSWWQSFKWLLDPGATLVDQSFSLGDRGDQPADEQRSPARLADTQIRTTGVLTHIENILDAAPDGKSAMEKAGDLDDRLDANVERLKALFRMPPNKDLIIREILVATQPPTRAVVAFMEGLTDKIVINDHIMQPLMLISHLDHHVDGQGEAGKTTFSIETVMQRLLPGHQASEKYQLTDIAENLLAGDTVVLFEGAKTAIAIDTKAPPGRSVGEPLSERVVLGAHDAFVEAFRVNVALVRRRLKDPRVVTDILTVGQISSNYVALMYVDGVVTPKLVAEVKRRIEAIKVDVVNATGVLEQYIEEAPSSLMPSTLTTERPDRVASYLSEGHVAIFVDNSPYAMICPTTFWSLMQTAEDYNLRYPFASLLRHIRLLALLTTLLVPSLYIAVVNYHHEMIPTQLMLFVAASREHVPMPAVMELIAMDLTFETIREAGTRIPGVIGPTIGLVASLILGNAAVEAKIVSPLMILVVAIAGIASFAIPDYLSGFAVRAIRFSIVIATTLLGFYGLAAGLFILVIYLAGMRSFGVPYLSPIAPVRGPVKDILNRPPMYEMEMRPAFVHPLDRRRQDEVVRAWDPMSKQAVAKAKPGPDGGDDHGA